MKPTKGRVVFYYEHGWANEEPRVAIIVSSRANLPTEPVTPSTQSSLSSGLRVVPGSEQDEKNYRVNLVVFHECAPTDRGAEVIDYVHDVPFHAHHDDKPNEPIWYAHWSWPPRV